jgi:thiosulfate dehydrogenase
MKQAVFLAKATRSLASTTFVAIGLGFATLAIATLAAPPVAADEMESSYARGGKLYDKWYKVIDVKAPKAAHPLYPSDKKYAKKPGTNWRCKECHGWDYRGVDGAYASGSHNTGIKGVAGMKGADPAKVVAILKGADHGYARWPRAVMRPAARPTTTRSAPIVMPWTAPSPKTWASPLPHS